MCLWQPSYVLYHYNDVIMGAMASQITSITIVYLAVYSGEDQRKNQSSASLAFVRAIHWWPVNFPHKGPVMWKTIPFDYVIMLRLWLIPVFIKYTQRNMLHALLCFVNGGCKPYHSWLSQYCISSELSSWVSAKDYFFVAIWLKHQNFL